MVEAARRKLELLGIEPDQIARIRSAAPVFTMYAPISGNVVQNQALRGSAVNPGDILYSLGTLEDVWITSDIYEDDFARVQVGPATGRGYYGLSRRGLSRHDCPYQPQPRSRHTHHADSLRGEEPRIQTQTTDARQIRIMVRPGQALIVPMDALVFETDSYFAYVDTGHNSFHGERS